MEIVVNEQLYLSQVRKSDSLALVRYLNDPEISRNTLMIPFPYAESDAEWFIKKVEEERVKHGRLTSWALRKRGGELIGGIGFLLKYGEDHFKDEIGYWIGKPFRRNGWMTETVSRFCEYGFREVGLERIQAVVFEHNLPSARVLVKAGFRLEGLLRRYYEKDGWYLNGMLYSRLSGE